MYKGFYIQVLQLSTNLFQNKVTQWFSFQMKHIKVSLSECKCLGCCQSCTIHFFPLLKGCIHLYLYEEKDVGVQCQLKMSKLCRTEIQSKQHTEEDQQFSSKGPIQLDLTLVLNFRSGQSGSRCVYSVVLRTWDINFLCIKQDGLFIKKNKRLDIKSYCRGKNSAKFYCKIKANQEEQQVFSEHSHSSLFWGG